MSVHWPAGWLLPAPPRSGCSYLHAPESFLSDWRPGLIFQITWEKFPGRGRGRPWGQRRTEIPAPLSRRAVPYVLRQARSSVTLPVSLHYFQISLPLQEKSFIGV